MSDQPTDNQMTEPLTTSRNLSPAEQIGERPDDGQQRAGASQVWRCLRVY